MTFYILPAVLFGWILGTNDSANIFGTAVTNKIIRYRTATIISAVFIVIGALTGGAKGLETISNVSTSNLLLASISTLASALTMIIMLNFLKIPVSSSQAVVGSIVAIGLIERNVNWEIILKLILGWIVTPISGIILSFILYNLLAIPFNKIKSIYTREKVILLSTIIIGAYGSFSLGANNVANITGVFAKEIGIKNAAFLGGISIAFGAFLSNKKVMYTVSKRIIDLDYFSSAISILGQSMTVWIFSILGIPISISHATVGAVIGTGLARGSQLTNWKTIIQIVSTWIFTPVFSGITTFAIYYFFKILN